MGLHHGVTATHPNATSNHRRECRKLKKKRRAQHAVENRARAPADEEEFELVMSELRYSRGNSSKTEWNSETIKEHDGRFCETTKTFAVQSREPTGTPNCCSRPGWPPGDSTVAIFTLRVMPSLLQRATPFLCRLQLLHNKLPPAPCEAGTQKTPKFHDLTSIPKKANSRRVRGEHFGRALILTRRVRSGRSK